MPRRLLKREAENQMICTKKRSSPVLRVLLSGGLALAALFLSASLTGCKDYDDDIASLQKQIDDINGNCTYCGECTDCK